MKDHKMFFRGRRYYIHIFDMEMGRGLVGAPRANRVGGAQAWGRSAFQT
jgi:hypothetical protein